MTEFKTSLELTKKSIRELTLLETQIKLKQDIDQLKESIQYLSTSKYQSFSEKSPYKLNKNKKSLIKLERKLDYFLKFKEIYDSIESFNKKCDIIRSEIQTIESQVREKYQKIIENEIIEKTCDLKHQLKNFDAQIKQYQLKPVDCLHCDVSGFSFNSMVCIMCGKTFIFGH